MDDFQGKVAVVTGAASGIGRALAEACIKQGMKVVLADVEPGALTKAEEELQALGGKTLSVQTDVSKADDVAALAEQAFATFGAVHLLFNNAGVGAGTTVWESSLDDWKWVLGVNLWGVIHGVHYFVPRMLKQGDAGYIVNTASAAGLTSHSGLGVYKTSKHAVVALSETLALDLVARNIHNIKVSVLCPEWVSTRIMESERNRPADLQENSFSSFPMNTTAQEMIVQIYQAVQSGIAPTRVADIVFDAIRQERFYILTHPTTKLAVQVRMTDILEEHQPTDILKAH
jgi:NAD(P)-dependent dehydrogenase (short-subunit alcohol dehydrogenase family)